MIKKYLSVLILLLPSLLMAQYKVVDESGKKPKWVAGMQSGYVIGLGTAGSMEEARDKAMNNVREQITESVAIHVSSVSKDMVREIMMGNKSNISSEYERLTATQTGKRDYLKGIAPSRIDASYWEKRKDKKSKAVSYFYAIKYPFNRFDLNELVKEFERKDAQLTKLLNQQIAITESFKTVEELKQCVSSLQKLIPIFIDERKSRAEVGLEKCRGLLNSVYIKDEGSEPGLVRYSLNIGNRQVSSAEQPRVSSNCAQINNVDLSSPVVKVRYDFEDCYEEPGNHVSVTYRVYRKTLNKKFYFGADADNFELNLVGDLKYDPGNDEIVLRIESAYDQPVNLELLELNGQLGWNISKSLNDRMDQKGIQLVTVRIDKTLDNKASNDIVSGYLHYSSAKSGEKKTLRIYRSNMLFSK